MKPASWQWVALIGVAILGVGLGLTALILALDDDTASPSLLAALPAPDRAAPALSRTEAVPIPGASARGVQEAAQPTRAPCAACCSASPSATPPPGSPSMPSCPAAAPPRSDSSPTT